MKSQHGFTLMELLIVITIGAILAGLAVPSFRTMVQDNRVTAATNTLIAKLALARSESITRRTGVVLCRSADPNAVAPVCGGGTAKDWTTGWLLFANEGGESPPTYDGGVSAGGVDVLINVSDGLTGNLQLRSNEIGDTHIEFELDGTSTLAIGTTASFMVCDDRQPPEDFGRQVDVNELGRAALIQPPIGDCEP